MLVDINFVTRSFAFIARPPVACKYVTLTGLVQEAATNDYFRLFIELAFPTCGFLREIGIPFQCGLRMSIQPVWHEITDENDQDGAVGSGGAKHFMSFGFGENHQCRAEEQSKE